MCLLLFSYKAQPDFPLILAANRDEFFDRPTAPLGYLDDSRTILGGKDLRGGGTWLGVSNQGKIGALTNYRDPKQQQKNTPSRGEILTDYLSSSLSSYEFLQQLKLTATRYNGFNLIVGDADVLCYFSNISGEIQILSPGLYGLSNHLLDTPWPKILRGKQLLASCLKTNSMDQLEDVFQLLQDQNHPPDSNLPDTGIGLEWERLLSPIFISGDQYGTRSSAVITMDEKALICFEEKTHDHEGLFPKGHKRFQLNKRVT